MTDCFLQTCFAFLDDPDDNTNDKTARIRGQIQKLIQENHPEKEGAMGGGVGVQQLAAFAKAKVTRHQARLVLANQATAASTKRKYKSAGEHFFAFLQETGAS